MIILKHQIPIKELSFDSIPYFKEDMILFDIETTGFSPKTSYIYMIGCVVNDNGQLTFTQFLSSERNEEAKLLASFFTLCKNYNRCVSFNGDGFDLPFLEEKVKKYDLPASLSCLESIDLYKKIKPLQTILKLENLKQKSIEKFLGIIRKDIYSGGELIEHYLSYEKTGNQKEKELLTLHNFEDLSGLVCLLSMLAYCFAFQGNYQFLKGELSCSKDYYGNPTETLLITARLQDPVPKPISYAKGDYYLVLRSDTLKLSVQVKENMIPVPYPDHKNYYYLEKEDMAVLKELAAHVDKKDRKPATVATAYGKFRLTEENIKTQEIFQPYIKQVLDLLVRWK